MLNSFCFANRIVYEKLYTYYKKSTLFSDLFCLKRIAFFKDSVYNSIYRLNSGIKESFSRLIIDNTTAINRKRIIIVLGFEK